MRNAGNMEFKLKQAGCVLKYTLQREIKQAEACTLNSNIFKDHADKVCPSVVCPEWHMARFARYVKNARFDSVWNDWKGEFQDLPKNISI